MHETRHRIASATAALIIAVGLGGCGGDGDATVVTDDGTISVDQDADGGSITIDSTEGSMTLSGESDGELPEGWPSNVVVPDGGTVNSSASFAMDEGDSWQVSLTYPGGAATDLIAQLKTSMQDAGFTVEAELTAAGQTVANFVGDGKSVTATASEDDEDGAVLIVLIAPED